MRIALAQINSSLGDFELNYRKILEYAHRAKSLRCDVVVFPEASLFGYHPMDLLERESIVREQLKALDKLEKMLPEKIAVVMGAFTKNPSKFGKPYYNTAFVLRKGQKRWSCHKELLPTYDVFDDARHIEKGDMSQNVLRINGQKVLITICEDIWAWPTKVQQGRSSSAQRSYYEENPLKKIKPGSVDLVLNLSASPFHVHKLDLRRQVTRATAKYLKCPLVYVNMVGGQDELIFDGASFAVGASGKILAQSARFNEDINIVDFEKNEGGFREISEDPTECLRQALVLGLRDFVDKVGIQKVHFGLSGGIDSALVACLAVDALGSQRVAAYALPGPFSSKNSFTLAKKLAQNLHIDFHTVPFTDEYKRLVNRIDKSLGRAPFGLSHENLQARLRGLILMAVSNRSGSMLLNTSNKSELAAGYGTLYGDLTGGLSPIGDLLKRDVYHLAKHYNSEHEIIPTEIIKRAPTAELRPNQKDQDTLPPYKDLDLSVVNLVEQSRPVKTKADQFLLKALMGSEFKRWQSPPILKVREHSFGRGRRMPVAHGAYF